MVPPVIPVVNNVDVVAESDPIAVKDALARQACRPVRWVEVIQYMVATGVTHLAECGPGRVLAGLTRRIAGSVQGYAMADAESMTQTLMALQR